ncbi:MAG: winged helix-turn-helix transcriptional regulator [Euryarchaeota archaeon]|nr:winged helix-turn-helix transcriptional regulator [Euryarchaeota archaeon]
MVAVVFAIPAAQAASYEREDEVQQDGAYAKSEFRGEFDVQLGLDMPVVFDVDAANQAGFAPQDSQFNPGFDAIQAFLAAFLASLPPVEPVAVPEPASAPDAVPAEVDVPQLVAEESDGVLDQGASVGSESSASNDGLSMTATAQAGQHSTTQSGSASIEEIAPLASQDRSASRESAPAADPEPAPPADEVEGSGSGLPAAVAPAFSGLIVESMDPVAAALATASVAVATTGVAVIVVPGWRTAAWKLARRIGGLLLFSRIAQSDILNHERRSFLLEFVKQNPGERVEIARRALGFSNGSMHYHLRVLQARDLLRVHKIGGCARLFVAGPRIQPAPYVPARRKKFLEVVSTKPGLTQREVASMLGLSERMVSYHVRTLHAQGLLDIRADGFRKRLFAKERPPLAATA